MTVKGYLSKVRKKETAIHKKESQLSNLKDLLTCITAGTSGERVQGTKEHDKLGYISAEIVDLEKEIAQDKDNLIDLKYKVTQQINRLSIEGHSSVLFMRYIQFMSWESIADKLGYSLRYTYKVHGGALVEFDRMHLSSLKGQSKTL